MPYINVAKPTSSVYTGLFVEGKQVYDQADITYDQSSVAYDTVSNEYTNVTKPVSSIYTKINKPT